MGRNNNNNISSGNRSSLVITSAVYIFYFTTIFFSFLLPPSCLLIVIHAHNFVVLLIYITHSKVLFQSIATFSSVKHIEFVFWQLGKKIKNEYESVVPEPNYRISIVLLCRC